MILTEHMLFEYDKVNTDVVPFVFRGPSWCFSCGMISGVVSPLTMTSDVYNMIYIDLFLCLFFVIFTIFLSFNSSLLFLCFMFTRYKNFYGLVPSFSKTEIK